jgi:GT2 family glycosyltransferase
MRKENEKPLISIVMLNYNGLKYLKKTLPPILKLDYPSYEFIIVDNGSTDKSIEFIKKFKKIKIIENGENLGYSKGKNIGVKHAKGDYILLLDNDILIKTPELLSSLLEVALPNRLIQIPLLNINSRSTNYLGIYFELYGQKFNIPEIKINKILNDNKLKPIGSFNGGFIFFNKKCWENLGFFDESQILYIDDTDMGGRAWIYGNSVYLYSKTFAIHLGIKRSVEETYIKRFRLFFSGHARSMIKNYKLYNLIYRLPIFYLFQLIKSIRYSFEKRTIKIFSAFIYSNYLFLKNLPDTLKQRKIIQSKRIIQEDIFLKIKPPKFD